MFASNTSQVSSDATYIEDVFSTYLYTGNGSTQTITNGIDLSTYGGMVWGKARSQAYNNRLFDTVRGGTNSLISNSTGATSSFSGFITSFNNNGFSIGTAADLNENGTTYTSWTFRKQPKFFDVVTWTGDDTSNRQIAHNLGSAPGCIILKSSSNASSWFVYHRSTGNDNLLFLNTTDAATSSPGSWATSSTTFTLGNANFNISGRTYVAYLFAHNAGGFGLTGTDNVISCGSYTGNGSASGPVVNLGYEPQFVIVKLATGNYDWGMYDNMRGVVTSGADNWLNPNSSAAESSGVDLIDFQATGFQPKGNYADTNSNGQTYIYIAIRRGPMKTPTSGTSVFAVDYQGQYTPKPPGHTSGFVTDMALVRNKNTTNDMINVSRLTGDNYLITSSTAAAGSLSFIDFDYMNGWGDLSTTDANYYSWMFRRAPGFFDVVCDTGTGAAHSITHGLTVAPELIIRKKRTGTNPDNGWFVYSAALGATKYLRLESNYYESVATSVWNNTSPTASVFTVGTAFATNESGATFVSYLFASCPGVSKVGSYTGTGATQTISCGFAARFVLIKRTDYDGDWFVWDTARGIVSANDPRLSLNTTSAEVTTDDSIDPDNSGFIVNQVSATNINVSSATYIYLAIA